MFTAKSNIFLQASAAFNNSNLFCNDQRKLFEIADEILWDFMTLQLFMAHHIYGWFITHLHCCYTGHMGWGLLKLCSLISPLYIFKIQNSHISESIYHVHIWQVSPQLTAVVTPVKYECEIQQVLRVLIPMKNKENSGVENNGLVTPTEASLH